MATWTREDVDAYWRTYPPRNDAVLRRSCYPQDPRSNFDPDAECCHTPAQTYTRRPCSCGRELWPPRGRGRGESLTSPRRIAAKLRALDALDLHNQGMDYDEIAQRLGYADHSGPAHAVQRLRDQEAAWARYEDDGGTVGTRARRQPTDAQLRQALAALEEELRSEHDLDAERLAAASDQLRRLLVTKASK